MDKKELISKLKGINATNPINAIIPSYCGEWTATNCNINLYNDDDGMLQTYQSEQRDNIEANSLQGLEGYELYNEIKQSL